MTAAEQSAIDYAIRQWRALGYIKREVAGLRKLKPRDIQPEPERKPTKREERAS